ncbi:C-C chemokine receptor type 1-like [Lineus longissimus]|uniref:C-C chemokine receptor type 1-like n=1 Tax=Lineus longissimus TaxID=88925 RepID=UPI00315DBEB3
MRRSEESASTTSPQQELSATDIIIGYYLPPIFLSLGFTGNLLIIVVLSQHRYRASSSCLYLRFLAMWGIAYLTVDLQTHLMTVFPEKVAKVGNAFCAEVMFFGYSVINMKAYTVVLMTFSRFIAVIFPLKAAVICTLTSVKRFQAVNVLFFGIWALPHVIYQKKNTDVAFGSFACKFDVPRLVAWGYELAHVTLIAILPFAIIIGFNICIIVGIRRRRKESSAMTGSGNFSDDTAVVTLVALATITFLICSTPYLIHVTFWDFASASKVLSPEQNRQYGMSQMVAMLFYKIYQCANFIIYFVACRRFREDFKVVIFCKWARR